MYRYLLKEFYDEIMISHFSIVLLGSNPCNKFWYIEMILICTVIIMVIIQYLKCICQFILDVRYIGFIIVFLA